MFFNQLKFINNIAIATKEVTMASKGLIKHHICGCNYADRMTVPGARNRVIMMIPGP